MADFSDSEKGLVIALYLIVFGLLFILWIVSRKIVKVVRHTEVMIIERFGKFHATLNPGIHFIMPFVDSPRLIHWRYIDIPVGASKPNVVIANTDRIDMREHVLSFGRQNVITKDTVQITIDALMYIRITDPKAAIYRVQNLPDSVELLAQTTLRNIIATLTLDDTFSSREHINHQLKERTVRDAERWGVTITRVEVMSIHPPADIKTAMELQIQKDREKRSAILNAEGEKESLIVKSKGTAAKMVLLSEADKTVSIQNAKAIAESKRLAATSEAEVIRIIRNAINNKNVSSTGFLVSSQYLESLQNIVSQNTNLYMVPESSVDFASNISKIKSN
ncbi:Stomatin protein 2 [Tieghemostelium lacteum]|uniref:Stomatin protein 2 n=1 Tax=Tieghemostelium lacteum TaxID=361077 RepID=A0A152A7Z2_TIELA|nr:Stomatin protein 2 [Tieghemostelium lacteum]|eukprot:KYR02251.1 Stomatin protein 2 [Tieghemostelium lacteum]